MYMSIVEQYNLSFSFKKVSIVLLPGFTHINIELKELALSWTGKLCLLVPCSEM